MPPPKSSGKGLLADFAGDPLPPVLEAVLLHVNACQLLLHFEEQEEALRVKEGKDHLLHPAGMHLALGGPCFLLSVHCFDFF